MSVEAPVLGRLASLWLETAARPPRGPLDEDIEVDVAVVGAGIVGLTTALLLKRSGARVAVLEGRRVAAGATGYNTAKLSSLHGITYQQLEASHGDGLARLYGEANEAGIRRIEEITGELGIDCDLRRKPNLTYAEDASDRETIEREVDAAQRLGLPASLVETCDLPFPIEAAVRFEEQAEFHPVKYVSALADAVAGDHGGVFEESMVVSVEGGSPCRVETDSGAIVTAGRVVVATHLPFMDRGLYFARCHPERSYVVAAPVEEAPAEMYLSTESPAHSIRAHLLDGQRWLLVAGESHKTGQGDEAERYRRLLAYARERFGIDEAELHWATQDQMPVDGVPYVGRVDPVTANVYIATGFRKWGLAMGTAAAITLAGTLEGHVSAWKDLFESNRVRARASATDFVKENVNVAFHFFADRVTRRRSADDLARGEGAVVGSGLGQHAAYRGEDGRLHTLSARCTHLGCILDWNGAERTWDCPCHGSRYAWDGAVVQGPAVRPLERKGPA